MKKVKIILWVIVVAFVVLLFFQNQEFFLEKKGINLNLSYVAGNYTPELPLAVWFLIVLIIGLLVAYFFGLAARFKLKKTIKELKAKIDTQIEMISQIRSELEARTGFSDQTTSAAPLDVVETTHEPSDPQASSGD
jgi:uncharacterized integral membrane protein